LLIESNGTTDNVFIVYDPTQVKSATGNSGAFDGKKTDIRFQAIQDTEFVNNRFNEELQQQIDGTLPKGHVYQLGKPSEILQSAGIPNLPIELSATHLLVKSKDNNHPFDIGLIKGLPKEISNPIAIFSYGDKGKAQNLIIEIEHKGNKLLVGVHFNQERNGIEVNSIRSLFPKENTEWLNWIQQGKLLYADKKRIQTLISQHQTNFGDVKHLDLNSIAKVIQDFQNPTLSSKFNAENQVSSRIIELSTEKEVADLTAQLLSTGLAKEVRMVTPEEMEGDSKGERMQSGNGSSQSGVIPKYDVAVFLLE